MDNEIPLGRRTPGYRCFEVLTAVLSIGMVATLMVLSIANPILACVFLLAFLAYMFIKAVRLGIHAITGSAQMRAAMRVPWHARLRELEAAQRGRVLPNEEPEDALRLAVHRDNVRRIAARPEAFPAIDGIYHAVIVPAYNEAYELIAPTMQSLVDATFDARRLIVVFAYEERGGAEMQRTAQLLEQRFGDRFAAFEAVRHPAGLPGEVPGKGGNITYAARRLQRLLDERRIAYDRVIVTSLDCDNRPDPGYFDLVAYEYVLRADRKRLSFQPISIFTNNIWDAPAPTRLIAAGNSIWNIVSSKRPRSLRNFASHAQPMDALVEMGFWSTRTIVEDGHQFWRSWFHFDGDYGVVSVPVPIYQDVVLGETFRRTMKAQASQLRRWAYGASDVPFVAVRLFRSDRRVPLGDGLLKFYQLIEGHVTLAVGALLIMFGPWVPSLLNGFDARLPVIVELLPFIVGTVQQVSMSLLVISVWVTMSILPPRPERVPQRRTLFMILQWLLLPVTSLAFNASSAIISQTQLAIGKYREVFVVTEKVAPLPVAAVEEPVAELPPAA